MSSYNIRRLLLIPIILFGVTLIIFVMVAFLSPTQRAALYVRGELPKDPNGIQEIIDTYGLDDPIPLQYVRWLGQLARFDLGFSKTGKEPVTDVIRSRMPATVELALFASILIIVLGVRFGILAALKHNKLPDQLLRIFSILGTSTPIFVMGLLGIMIFAVQLGWLPTSGRLDPASQRLVDSDSWHTVTGMYTFDAVLNGNIQVFTDAVHHLILPVLSLTYLSVAVLLRVTRSSMLEVLGQDYVRTARAKGMGERAVIQKHARPNAMLPVVTLAGLTVVALLNGAAITETVFNWPGLGKRFVDAAVNLDVVTVLGLAVFSATVLIVGNLIVDILYAYIDPRVRLS
jgi:peptide/nickel transport system permease protein